MDTADAIPPPGTPPVDVKAFREQMREAGVESVVGHILATFSGDLTNQAELLRAALQADDVETVASRAHGFKSASGSVHAYRLQALLSELEIRAQESGLDGCGELADQTFEEIERVRTHLDALNSE